MADNAGEMVTVTFTWLNEHGMCADCGDLPASYLAPDLTFTHMSDGQVSEVVTGHKLCPVCAALWASHGERLERLWKDEEGGAG
jgi:ribosomal protein S27AE